MEPKRAWGVFSFVLFTAVAVAAASFYNLGIDLALVLSFAIVVPVFYLYVVYKRYNVEVITENDAMMIDDPEDLRIICSIYGLDATGKPGAMRQRLLSFVQKNKDNAFTWVAPKVVLSVGSSLQMPETGDGARPGQFSNAKPLVGGKTRDEARLSAIDKCPVCGARAPKKGSTCSECGADLEYYAALGELKLGKLMLSEKAASVHRKPRNDAKHVRKS
jgi:hypothetical protein